MKPHRFELGIIVAVAGLMLVWGSMQTVSAQMGGDPAENQPMSSSTNMQGDKIIDKVGGTMGIETLTDRFLHGLMGMDQPMPMPGSSGTSGSGMGNMNPTSYDYTAVREHVRAALCKAAGGDCKVTKLTKSEKMNEPQVNAAQWDAAISDFKTALGTYDLTDKQQDKLIAAVTSMRKDLMSGKGTMNSGDSQSNMKDENKTKSGTKSW